MKSYSIWVYAISIYISSLESPWRAKSMFDYLLRFPPECLIDIIPLICQNSIYGFSPPILLLHYFCYKSEIDNYIFLYKTLESVLTTSVSYTLILIHQEIVMLNFKLYMESFLNHLYYCSLNYKNLLQKHFIKVYMKTSYCTNLVFNPIFTVKTHLYNYHQDKKKTYGGFLFPLLESLFLTP